MPCRIIPAHAGFTKIIAQRVVYIRDHPRTRGVYGPLTWIQAMTSGSSPHTRGLHVPERGGHYEDGIIPAHAGFTSRFASARTTSRDHPRTRGVYDAQSLVQEGDIGSSPHTRGLLYAASGEITGPRIIPAHAGFTSQGGPRAREPPDHPRTRGVYFPPRDRSIPRVGSSPHTRGLQSAD